MKEQQVVGVVGLGYVGLPLLMAISGCGYRGLGFDVETWRVEMLNAGESYLDAFDSKDIEAHVKSGNFEATADMARLAECNAILICVPTPLNQHREPDLTYVVDTTRVIAKYLQKDQLVVLESTTYPGTTEEVMMPILEESGLKCGKDFFLAYSPEREDPGNINFTTSTMPKVIGGVDEESAERATVLYQRFINEIVSVSSAKTAEAVKLTENIFRAVNIGLVNELKMVFDKMDIDIFEVIDAAKTKPFGFMPFYPGPGCGGHCIPIDPFYLTWKAREYGERTRFIELAGEINNSMPRYVVEQTASALEDVHSKKLSGARILVVGVAYKANVDDMRESPSIQVIQTLQQCDALVDYHDPHIPEFDDKATGHMKSVELTEDNLATYDAAIICTPHAKVDWDNLVSSSSLVIDSRNATRDVVKNRERIIKA